MTQHDMTKQETTPRKTYTRKPRRSKLAKGTRVKPVFVPPQIHVLSLMGLDDEIRRLLGLCDDVELFASDYELAMRMYWDSLSKKLNEWADSPELRAALDETERLIGETTCQKQ